MTVRDWPLGPVMSSFPVKAEPSTVTGPVTLPKVSDRSVLPVTT